MNKTLASRRRHVARKLSAIALRIRRITVARAAGIDLSYNEPSALRDIAELDRGFREARPVTEAFVVEKIGAPQSYDTLLNGQPVEVLYRLDCDLKLLNRYTPFSGCLHNGAWTPVLIDGDEINFADYRISGKTDRKTLAEFGLVLSKF